MLPLEWYFPCILQVLTYTYDFIWKLTSLFFIPFNV